jgi:hypothetical protein
VNARLHLSGIPQEVTAVDLRTELDEDEVVIPCVCPSCGKSLTVRYRPVAPSSVEVPIAMAGVASLILIGMLAAWSIVAICRSFSP